MRFRVPGAGPWAGRSDGAAPSRAARAVPLAVGSFFALVAAATGGAAWHLAPLTWDGAYYLFEALDRGRPVAHLGRTVNVVLQSPVLAARRLTDDLAVLRLVFALPYVLVPLLGLVGAWLVCRRTRPDLFVWPAIGVCLAALPGQLFYTSEGPLATHLFWPVLLAPLSGVTRRHLLWLWVPAALAWAAHPIAAVLFGIASLAAAERGRRAPETRTLLWVLAAACAAAALAKALSPLTAYESENLRLSRVVDAVRFAAGGRVGAALVCVAGAAVLSLGQRWLLPRAGVRTRLALVTAPAALALLSGAALIPWARDPIAWARAVDYRFITSLLAPGLMLMAVVDGLLGPGPTGPTGLSGPARAHLRWGRSLTALAAGVSFAVVLTLQGRSWFHLRTLFADSLAERPPGCVPLHQLPDVAHTALDHWGSASLSVVLQGRRPTRVALPDNGCARMAAAGVAAMAPGGERGPADRWFILPG